MRTIGPIALALSFSAIATCSAASMHVTVPYPPGMSSPSYAFVKLTDTKFKLGKQVCVKK